MVTAIRAIIRVFLVLGIILSCGFMQFLCLWLPRPQFYFWPSLLCKGVLWALDIKLEISGEVSKVAPTLFLANHASYIDIIILQALVPASFVSKAEVAKWPLFGQLAYLEGCIFIHRKRSETKNQAEEISRRLKSGGNLVLFPEGTTSDASRILPLKSSLLGVATEVKAVQPITIGFTALDGLPPGRTFRYYYAWMGDESLPPHMWRILTMGDMTVRVKFHEAIQDNLGDRKALAARVETVMRESLSQSLTKTA